MDTDTAAFAVKILQEFGATQKDIDLLLDYVANPMSLCALPSGLRLPLSDEPFAAVWKDYAQKAGQEGFLQTLCSRLIQLNFPVQEGLSQDSGYQAAVKKGQFPAEPGPGPLFSAPEQLKLFVHDSPAGSIGVLMAGNRQDFVTLVQALVYKNEPVPVPESLGAFMVSGYNNWERIKSYRRQWMQGRKDSDDGLAWSLEFQNLKKKKNLYQDRFIILSSGFYSGIQPATLGLSPQEWQEYSLRLRLEHECTHYFTLRFFSSMRKNIWDEILADYMGILAARGSYSYKWFLLFLGLENYPAYRAGARLEKYLPEYLTESAFEVLKSMTRAAAINLQKLDQEFGQQFQSPQGRSIMLLTLCVTGLCALASSDYREIFLQNQSAVYRLLKQ